MKANIMKIITNSIVLFIIFITFSCSEDLKINDENDLNTNELNGIPLILDSTILDSYSETRSGEFEWPEGAIIDIIERGCRDQNGNISVNCSNHLHENVLRRVCAIYSKEKGWVCYRVKGNMSYIEPHTCEVRYSEEWSNTDFEEAIINHDNLKHILTPYHPIYTDDNSVCSYKDGIVYLKANLTPMFGRVRFVNDASIAVEYNHAQTDLFFYHEGNGYATQNDYLRFNIENDGRYYSNYIYTNLIPEIRVGDYVYKYAGNREIQPGSSGVISLPTSTESTKNWICERYFEIVDESGGIVELDNNASRYYLLYAKKFVEDINMQNYSDADNQIHSLIGLNIEMEYTIELDNTYDAALYLYIYNKDKKCNFYSGYSYMYLPTPEGYDETSVGHIKLHNCNTSQATWFSPVVYFERGESFNIKRIKYSNF